MSAGAAFKLRLIHHWDRLQLARFRRRFGSALRLDPGVSPNLRFAHLRMEPGASLRIGAGFATERQPGNRLWLRHGAELALEEQVWLRTELGENRVNLFPGARVSIGARSLLNGAMLHAKREITLGRDTRLAFGVRVLDADMHPLDANTAETIAPVRIGHRVWIAADVLVLRGVTIGDDCVIAAGSVVVEDVPPRSLAAGVPAKVIRSLASRERCP